MNSTADSETSSIDPASFSSTETGSTEDFAETSFTEDRTEIGSNEDLTETGCTEDHDSATTETSSTEDSPPFTETRSSALLFLSVDLSDLNTCPPPSILSDDQKYQILTILPALLKQNTRALLAIIDCIQFLVKQGLGLRGSD